MHDHPFPHQLHPDPASGCCCRRLFRYGSLVAMQALSRTTRIEQAAPAQRAGLEGARSRPHQIKGRRADAPLFGAAVDQAQFKLGRSLHHRFFYSHRPNSSLGRLVARGAFASDPTITNFVRVDACKRSRGHTVPHQQIHQCLADVGHFSIALSSSLFSSGIDPNENGLTHEAEPLSPRGKTYV